MLKTQNNNLNNSRLNPSAQSAARVSIDLAAIAANYSFLKKQTSAMLMPVIKADAYGHGLVLCGQELIGLGAEQLAVGTVREAGLLRQAEISCPIVALLGCLYPGDIEFAAKNTIIPFVSSFDQLKGLTEVMRGKEMRIALKFNTGMNRLGFGAEDMGPLLTLLGQNPGIIPFMLASHLASADEETGGDSTCRQIRIFDGIIKTVRVKYPQIKTSLFNSAGILAYAKTLSTDVVRPGLALYGANPLFGTGLNRPEIEMALKAAMQVKAPVVQVHALHKGESISYGCTFTAPVDLKVAIVGAGYAQGYGRGMSNKSEMCLNGKRCRVLGRICMQLTAIDVTDVDVQEGDFAYLLGGEGENAISVQELSTWWGTIPYEVFCMLGCVNQREYK